MTTAISARSLPISWKGGYPVAALDSGWLVLDTVQATLPDMVILDIQLGDLDSRDICRELKAGLATKDSW